MSTRALTYGLLFSAPMWAIGYIVTVAINRT